MRSFSEENWLQGKRLLEAAWIVHQDLEGLPVLYTVTVAI
jgi:hypothetical protein